MSNLQKRFAVAFFSESAGMIQRLIAADTEVQAIRAFFDLGVPGYSADSEGFAWFFEDFYQSPAALGALIPLQDS